ncbi:MAG: hypothetical protein B7Z55_17730, partial [Planctomycetales bacterium 12-60-4]
MKNFHFARFLVVVEQSRNFNYATSPRTTTSFDFARCVPSVRSRTTTLDAIQREITSRLSKYLPNESARFLVWLLDSDDNPILFVTGLLDVRHGKLSREQLAKWSDALLPQITSEQSMTELSVTVSATAELTFCEEHDFETTDYEGDGDERDEMIAQDMVDDSCGHLEGSYMSYVERDEQYLYVNAEVTETVTVEVPWGH